MDKGLWEKCVKFHGHECPGLAIGFRACQGAMEKLGIGFSTDEEIVCVTENDACGVDAVQVLIGCTLGKGNLLYRNTGKQAFSFFNRKTGECIRIVLKPVNNIEDKKERQWFILNSRLEDIFEFKTPSYGLPDKAHIFKTLVCDRCGEGAAEHKMRIMDGEVVCLDCFDGYDRGWSKAFSN